MITFKLIVSFISLILFSIGIITLYSFLILENLKLIESYNTYPKSIRIVCRKINSFTSFLLRLFKFTTRKELTRSNIVTYSLVLFSSSTLMFMLMNHTKENVVVSIIFVFCLCIKLLLDRYLKIMSSKR